MRRRGEGVKRGGVIRRWKEEGGREVVMWGRGK